MICTIRSSPDFILSRHTSILHMSSNSTRSIRLLQIFDLFIRQFDMDRV
jgi:hypothetical protein